MPSTPFHSDGRFAGFQSYPPPEKCSGACGPGERLPPRDGQKPRSGKKRRSRYPVEEGFLLLPLKVFLAAERWKTGASVLCLIRRPILAAGYRQVMDDGSQIGISRSLPPYMKVWSRRVTWFCSERSWAAGRRAA